MSNKKIIESTAVQGVDAVTQEGDMTMDKKVYEFRTLNATDTFLMFKILGKIGINEFAECFGKENVNRLLTGNAGVQNFAQAVGIQVVFEMVNVIMNNLPKCEVEIYTMLANTSNLSVEEIKKLDFATFMEMVIDFVKKPEFKDFIKVVSRLFK